MPSTTHLLFIGMTKQSHPTHQMSLHCALPYREFSCSTSFIHFIFPHAISHLSVRGSMATLNPFDVNQIYMGMITLNPSGHRSYVGLQPKSTT